MRTLCMPSGGVISPDDIRSSMSLSSFSVSPPSKVATRTHMLRPPWCVPPWANLPHSASQRKRLVGSPKHALQLLRLLADEGGGVRELLLARRGRCEPQRPVRLERVAELFQPGANSCRLGGRALVGRVALERSRARGQRRNLTGDD